MSVSPTVCVIFAPGLGRGSCSCAFALVEQSSANATKPCSNASFLMVILPTGDARLLSQCWRISDEIAGRNPPHLSRIPLRSALCAVAFHAILLEARGGGAPARPVGT